MSGISLVTLFRAALLINGLIKLLEVAEVKGLESAKTETFFLGLAS